MLNRNLSFFIFSNYFHFHLPTKSSLFCILRDWLWDSSQKEERKLILELLHINLFFCFCNVLSVDFLIKDLAYPKTWLIDCFSLFPNRLKFKHPECYFALKAWHGQLAGAAAVLVADSIDEPLITMDSPEESSDANDYVEKINIPSALIERSFGESLKQALKKGEEIVLKLDWRESMPHPDQRVEYELWTNSNDECGTRCDEQMNFIKNFKGHAQILERGGYTMFTPHYITWYCPKPFILSSQCKSQCINHGRYCAPDPEQDFGEGFEGKDVVFENLRQLCVHRVANESNRSWVWWDYVTDFHIRCSMKEKRYSKECAEDVMKSLGKRVLIQYFCIYQHIWPAFWLISIWLSDLPIEKIRKCMGDPEADVENEILKTEQEVQVSHPLLQASLQ